MTAKDRMFFYDVVDLNSDGKLEYFVTFQGPYLCGSGGCTLYILNSDFSLHTKMTQVRLPLYVSKNVTAGWKNLLIPSDVQTCGQSPHLLKYNGTSYPSNPSVEPCEGITIDAKKGHKKMYIIGGEGVVAHAF